LEAPLRELGAIEGSLTLAGWRLDAPARPQQALDGTLRARVDHLDRVSDLIPDVTGVTGAIDSDLRLTGTLGAPDARGDVRIAGVGLQVPLIGLNVSDLALDARVLGIDRLEAEGSAKVGGGQLTMGAEASLGGEGVVARATLSGERLTVANTKEYFALVSPRIALDADARGLRLSGEIQVPEARIRPRSIPAGVKTPSKDVVLVTEKRSAPLPMAIDLRLVLGEEVTVDAFGVRGRLAGNLAVRQEPGRQMMGDGQLQIIDGQYRIATGFGLAAELGAPLTIVQGRMIYASSPIDNPGLVIQAEREQGQTVAGVRVLGTLRDPKLAFFSESDPGMTQAEVTKFLLTGIAPTGNDEDARPSLAVGTYIAPKLYLEYGSGVDVLGEEGNSVRLRYDLSKRVEVQTETGGGGQGIDLFYTFER
jgi:translocation and assembly module TamB